MTQYYVHTHPIGDYYLLEVINELHYHAESGWRRSIGCATMQDFKKQYPEETVYPVSEKYLLLRGIPLYEKE